MADRPRIIVLEGDQTGQELLEQALRLLDADVCGLDARARALRPVAREPPPHAATRSCWPRRARWARPATASRRRRSRPRARTTSAAPTRSCARRIDGKVIIRTGRRIPGVTAGRRASTTRSRSCAWRSRTRTAPRSARDAENGDEVAFRTERIQRSICRAVAEYAFRTADAHARARVRRAEVDGQPRLRGHAEGGDGRGRRAPPRRALQPAADRRHLRRAWSAARAGLAARDPGAQPRRRLRCRSWCCALFGSIAGAESVLLSFDEELRTRVVMTEAPHGTAPALEGKDIANPMAMILAVAALLRYVGERRGRAGGDGVARDLRGGAGGDGVRRAHARPRRPRDDDRVHRRGDRARADEDRDLVDASSGEPAAERDRRALRRRRRSARRGGAGDGAAGDGTPIVLAHGLTATRRYVLHGSRAAASAPDHRVISYDARGHGESDPAPDPGAYEYADLVATSRRVLDELGLDARGAGRASRWARPRRSRSRCGHPERVAALVQITPAHLGLPQTRPGRAGALGRARGRAWSATASRASCAPTATRRSSRAFRGLIVRGDPAAHRAPPAPEAVADALRVVPRSTAFDGVEALEQMAVPTLIVASRDELDPEHPYEVAQELRRAHPGRRAGERGARARRRWPGAARSSRGRSLGFLERAGVVGRRVIFGSIEPILRDLCAASCNARAEHVFCPTPFLPCEPMFWQTQIA